MGWAARNRIGRLKPIRFTGKVPATKSRPVRRAEAFVNALGKMPRFEASGRLIPRRVRRDMARTRAKNS